MEKYLLPALLLFNLTGCAAPIHKQPHLSGSRIIWVKDFELIGSVKVGQGQRRNISDKIALILDAHYDHKFSAVYRNSPPDPETSLVVTGAIYNFGSGSLPVNNPFSTRTRQPGAGKLSMEFTVVDAATGEKLIDKTRISYIINEDNNYYEWTRIEQTVDLAVEKIAGSIGQLKINPDNS